MPHTPLYASENFYGKSKAGLYGDVIEEIDFNMGRIMKKLIDENLHKNTIVVFTSDNGPWLPYDTHGGSAGLLREGKGTTWEGGQRVPGLFWGGSIKPGTISDLGSTLDIFPTFLDFAGIDNINDRIVDGTIPASAVSSGAFSNWCVKWFYGQTNVCNPGCCCNWSVPTGTTRMTIEAWGAGGINMLACLGLIILMILIE